MIQLQRSIAEHLFPIWRPQQWSCLARWKRLAGAGAAAEPASKPASAAHHHTQSHPDKRDGWGTTGDAQPSRPVQPFPANPIGNNRFFSCQASAHSSLCNVTEVPELSDWGCFFLPKSVICLGSKTVFRSFCQKSLKENLVNLKY